MSNTRKAAKKTAPRKATTKPPEPESIDDLLDDDTAGPAETTVPLCLRANLVAEWEELNRQLEDMPVATMPERAARRKLAEQIQELEQRMRAGTVNLRFRANRGEFARLRTEHPPRRGEDGKVVDDDVMGVNSETFFEPLIRAMLVEPKLTAAQWDKLFNRISDGQLDQLWRAAWTINRGKVEVPFSRAASRTIRGSEQESQQPAASASPSNGSRVGSRSR